MTAGVQLFLRTLVPRSTEASGTRANDKRNRILWTGSLGADAVQNDTDQILGDLCRVAQGLAAHKGEEQALEPGRSAQSVSNGTPAGRASFEI